MSVEAKRAIDCGWSKPIPVAYNARDLALYAIGTGSRDLRYIYEKHDDFAALPWYAVVLPFKGDSFDALDFPSETMIQSGAHVQGQPAPAGPVLDGERFVEVIKPLPKEGAKLFIKSRCIAITDKRSGASYETESLITDAQGTAYIRMVSAAFYVGVTGFESAGTSNSKSVKMPKRAPDKVIEQKTADNSAELYRLSGDYNPLHVDPGFAKAFGFPQPILHGLCTFGYSARHVLQAYADNNADNFKSVQVRFSKPVFPGETLVTKMWKEGNRVLFETEVKERGKVCMSSCFMELKPVAAKL